MTNEEVRKEILALVVSNDGDWIRTLSDVNEKNTKSEEFKQKSLQNNNNFIVITEEDYPIHLKNSFHSPFILFYEGDKGMLYSNKLVAIFNDNIASIYATETIRKITDDLIGKCIFVLPFGRAKHNDLVKRIISKGGKVIAVLNKAVGIQHQEDKGLYQELVKNHLVISILPNRLDGSCKESMVHCYKVLATLCNRILIGAISKTSAHYFAVASALQMGSDLFCIPFPAGSNYIGNTLIHDGAILTEDAETIIVEGRLE